MAAAAVSASQPSRRPRLILIGRLIVKKQKQQNAVTVVSSTNQL
ncbi:MAG: hypothetical protein ACLR6J_10135 [Parabacteroides merdae]